MNENNIIKPCFPYPGGKTRFLKHLLPMVPAHRIYVEPFAGGLAMLLAKPRSEVEVVNDLNKEIVTFYRYMRRHPDSLLNELDRYMQSRAEFESLRDVPGDTDLQIAVRWFLVTVNSFGSKRECWGRTKTGWRGYSRERYESRIRAVAERLNHVWIECGDWSEVVSFYDAEDAFFFVDPPYVEAQKTAYRPFNEDEMQRVCDVLVKSKARWVLTCDNSEACRTIFKGLPRHEVPIKYSLPRVSRREITELIVHSPNLNLEALPKAA